jgi:hypothetical protein
MVFSSTGQMQPDTMTAIFMPSLMPTSSISTGTRTGGGRARFRCGADGAVQAYQQARHNP